MYEGPLHNSQIKGKKPAKLEDQEYKRSRLLIM